METIVAGRFETGEQAERAMRHLITNGFHHDDTSAFFVNPKGQHGEFPIGGDQYADANATRADEGAVAGAAAGGAAGAGAAAVAGAAGALAATGAGVPLALGVIALGAYTGSLAGTLAKLGGRKNRDETAASPGRAPGMLVAVRVLSPQAEAMAVDVLQQEGAADIEHAKGVWENGDWKDFDPVAPPDLVSEGHEAEAQHRT